MLKAYSAGRVSSISRIGLILSNSLKYSVHSCDKSNHLPDKLDNEDGGHYLSCLLQTALFWSFLCSAFWQNWKVSQYISSTSYISFFTHLLNFVDFVIHKSYICYFSGISQLILVFKITVVLVFFALGNRCSVKSKGPLVFFSFFGKKFDAASLRLVIGSLYSVIFIDL